MRYRVTGPVFVNGSRLEPRSDGVPVYVDAPPGLAGRFLQPDDGVAVEPGVAPDDIPKEFPKLDIEIPSNWRVGPFAVRRAIARKLGAPNNVKGDVADRYVEAYLRQHG